MVIFLAGIKAGSLADFENGLQLKTNTNTTTNNIEIQIHIPKTNANTGGQPCRL